ncbi:MAG: hypothetical protein HYV27_05635 [Candidatus Hydrogenedentes bacterium]|nr:hypothetical protein [Candidatus Hydrogenedentota bacterium]
MAVRLGEYVVYGELLNTRQYGTHGFLAMRAETEGDEHIIRFELTGDCARDLKGKHVRFFPEEGAPAGPVFPDADRRSVQQSQIGPTALMTAEDWARVFDCPVEEYLRRCDLGEPPPTRWARRLYLEWYSQNGRVLVEMAPVRVDVCLRAPTGEDDEGEWEELPNLALPPDETRSGAPGVTLISQEDGAWNVSDITPEVDDESEDPDLAALDRLLAAEAASVERALGNDPDAEDELRKHMLMDHCLESCEEVPLGDAIGGVADLPRPEALDDAAVEVQLKLLLGRMALSGIALDVCEHYSPRACYTLLVDTLLKERNVFEELIGSGWVTHMCTWEFCAECEAETEEKFKDYDPSKGIDDLPF